LYKLTAMNSGKTQAMDEATLSDDQKRYIKYEQILLAYKLFPTLTFANFVASLVLIVLFWSKTPIWAILIWLASLILTVYIATSILHIAFNRAKPDQASIDIWGRRIAILGYFRSSAWSMAGILFYNPDSVVHIIILVMFMIGGATLYMTAAAAYRPLFRVALPILLVPLVIRLLIDASTLTVALAVIVIMHIFVLIYFYNRIHTTILESLLLRVEKNKLVLQLSEKNKEVELESIAKSKFLAVASHDLRQPLHAQGLYVAELLSLVDDEKQRGILKNLESSLGIMRGLFGSLLDISKLDAGVVTPIMEDFPLKKIFDLANLNYAGKALDKSLNFYVVDSSLYIKSDVTLMMRIISNLVDNAIRYTDKGGILLGCRRRGDQVSIEVWDTGCGIAQDQQCTIFHEFYQVENPERDRTKGLGLGLAIVKRQIELLGCTIELTSKEGRGSAFRVQVPKGRAEHAVQRTKISIANVNDITGANIIIIDDDIAILKGMQGLLSNWGCNVLFAESGEEAISKIRAKHFSPDVIVSDYRLRGNKTGIEAINGIRGELNNVTPGILITGDTDPNRLQEAAHSGFSLLHKPVGPDKLRSLLGYAIRK